MRSLEGSIILSVLIVIKIVVHKGVSGSGIQYAPQNTLPEMERMGFSPRTTISFSKDGPVHTASSSVQRAQLLTHLLGLGLSPGVAPTTTSGEQRRRAVTLKGQCGQRSDVGAGMVLSGACPGPIS